MKNVTLKAIVCNMGMLAGCALDAAPDEASAEQADSAPPLSLIQVVQVASANVPNGELIAANQFSTALDEGGAWLNVWTNELGIGGHPVATFNGSTLPPSALANTFPICQDFSGRLEFICSPGEPLVGFQNVWNLSGNQSGLFTYRNTSITSPFNTLSTAINIQ